MKIFNVLFLAIRQKDFDFLVRRHNIDVQLYCAFDSRWDVRHIKHYEDNYIPDPQSADQVFFPGNNSFSHLPLSFGNYVRQQKPDVIIAHSFSFAFQQFILNFFLPKKTKLIVQHHAESPFKNPIKLWLQKKAFRWASAYLFSSRSMADEFIRAGIIRDKSLVYEMPESSTTFRPTDKAAARQDLNLPHSGLLFLWVGRLNANKDPLTVLKAFRRYAQHNAHAQLYMFYHEDDMIAEVTQFIQTSGLSNVVHLNGRVAQDDLEAWYNACDYFISASYYESTGYALCEALACGCVPIASDIPSFQKLTNHGECAILFEPGDDADLYEKLGSLSPANHDAIRLRAITHFKEELSFPALSKKFAEIVRKIHHEQ